MTYEEWVDTYQPIQNPIVQPSDYNGTLIGLTAPELIWLDNQEIRKRFTLVEVDGVRSIYPNIITTNRIGHFVSSIDWGKITSIVPEIVTPV